MKYLDVYKIPATQIQVFLLCRSLTQDKIQLPHIFFSLISLASLLAREHVTVTFYIEHLVIANYIHTWSEDIILVSSKTFSFAY